MPDCDSVMRSDRLELELAPAGADILSGLLADPVMEPLVEMMLELLAIPLFPWLLAPQQFRFRARDCTAAA